MARDLQDAMKWNIFLQLLTHIPALSGPDHLASSDLASNNAKVLEKFVEKVVFAKHREDAMDKLREYDTGGILISFDELKRNPELRRKLAKEFVRVHNDLLTLEAKKRMEDAVDKAIAAAEKIAERKTPYFDEFGKRKFKPVFESPEDIYKIPELVEFLKLVEEVVPKNILKEPLSKPLAKGKVVRPKKTVEEAVGDLSLEAQKLLGILNGLKFGNYSNVAVQNAIKSLKLEVERLSENPVENLELVGLYCLVIRALEKGDLKKPGSC